MIQTAGILLEGFGRMLPRVCAAFGIEPRGPLPLLGGTANISFVVGGDERLIVTFCPGMSVPRAERLAELLQHLAEHDFPTNRILRTETGASCYVVDGTPVIVKDYVPGRPLGRVEPATAREIGDLLARLHAVPAPTWLADDHGMGRAAMVRVAEGARDEDFAGWITTILEALRPTDDLPTGLVHGDLFPDNIIRRADGRLIAIDFEEACRYPLVFDLAMALVGLGHADSLTQDRARALVEGYTARRRLAPAERSRLPTMFECAAAMTGCWRYRLQVEPPGGEVRSWRAMRELCDHSRSWRRTGVWSEVLGAPVMAGRRHGLSPRGPADDQG